MSTSSQGITGLLKLKWRIIQKLLVVWSETRKRGGRESRNDHRSVRFERIKAQKLAIRDSLIASWGLGEIKPPTEEERIKFWLYYHYLPMDYILEVKKKYWNL